MSSSTAYYTHLHDRDVQSNDGTEHKDEDQWSGDDQDSEDGGPRKRKSAKTSGPSGPMSVSCELCKNRKVKCDRGHPQCGWCVRNGQICEYKERRKPGLRAGYGRALEARLDKLEGVLETHQHILQRLTASEIEVGAAANGPVSTNVRSNQDLTTRSLPQYTGLAGMCSTPGSDARVSDGTPQLSNEMSQQQASNFLRHASQSSLSGPRFRSGNVYAPSDPPVQSPSLNIARAPEAYSVKHNSIPSTVFYDADLPPYDLLYALTELFFQHINTWCPILYRRTTLDTLFGPTPLEEADCILLHAIVATTLRFSIDPRLNEALRERYYNTSKQKVLLYGLENSSVKALQALVSDTSSRFSYRCSECQMDQDCSVRAAHRAFKTNPSASMHQLRSDAGSFSSGHHWQLERPSRLERISTNYKERCAARFGGRDDVGVDSASLSVHLHSSSYGAARIRVLH